MGIYNLEADKLKSCAELYVNVFNSEPWNDEWTFEAAYKRLNDIFLTPNFIGVCFEENSKLIGAVFGNCEHWYEGMHYNLKEMFVSKELQGKGIGSQLLKALEEQLKMHNAHTIILFTSKGNKTSEFYQSNSFKELGDMSMMAKSID